MPKVSALTDASLPLTGAETLYVVQSGNSRKITVDDVFSAPGLKTALGATGAAPVFACRAWVNFNGTGTVAIRASGNVSSITDNGTGDYTVNFTDAMPDANYAVHLDHATSSGTTSQVDAANSASAPTLMSTTQVRVTHRTTAGALTDCANMFVSIFR